MGAIKNAADVAYADGPTSSPSQPDKEVIRAVFGTVDSELAAEAAARATADSVLEALATAGIKWTTQIIEGRSTGNVNLASGLVNGATLNGLTVQTGKHYFIGSQTDPAENGIYTAVASGAASRATFANSAAELAYIGFVLQGGTVGAGEGWTLVLAAADIVVGTTALNFSPAVVAPGYAAEVLAARGGEASLLAAMNKKAPLASPALTGTPTAPTAPPGTATTQLANTAFVAAVSPQAIDPTPEALAWAAVQSKANGDKAVLIGVRSTDGRIINPSFEALWDAVFGGTVATGSLLEADSIIMHGPRIYAVEGRAFDLFAPSLLPNRNSGVDRYFALQSVLTNGQPLNAVWRDHVRVHADDLGATARIKLVNEGIAGVEFSKSLTVVKSAASKAATPRVAMIGDSITNGAHLITEDRFVGYSVTPYFMGTRRPTTLRNSWAEGRGGWGATDYCYDRTTYIPLPAGQEATALANQTDNRNPFIRTTTGGDDPAMVRNGYIFDYRYYLNRFSMADPDVVIINLGTNDIAQIGLPGGWTRARDCVDIMVSQISTACPGAIIGLCLAQKGNSITENPLWYQGYANLWLHWHETYGASSDVHVLSTHAMASDRLNFPMSTSSTNSQTGQVKQELSDGIHPDTVIGYEAYSEGVFAFIHAMS